MTDSSSNAATVSLETLYGLAPPEQALFRNIFWKHKDDPNLAYLEAGIAIGYYRKYIGDAIQHVQSYYQQPIPTKETS